MARPLVLVTPGSCEGFRDRLVEDLEGNVNMLLCKDQGRRPADGVGAAAQNYQALLVARHFYPVTKCDVRLQGGSVSNELYAEHHAEPTNIAYALVLAL